jgi:UDP-N-acetylglucosamine 2-epimerase (non-hydrolysing)
MSPTRILIVAGARPNFMKIAPIVRELRRHPTIFEPRLAHTGQHYDAAMSGVFFEQLGIPAPDVNLNVGSGSHAQQTAAIMIAFEPLLVENTPGLLVVVGDVNSTLACSLVAVKLGIPVAHVEAGLRSFDRTMPEEINRVLTDQISDLLFTTETSANENLAREGIRSDAIHFVGNVMIDTLLAHRERARKLKVPTAHGLAPREYVVLTLHRPSNVDEPSVFEQLMQSIEAIASDFPIVFPVHPRTRPAMMRSPIAERLVKSGRLRLMDPLGYVEFLGLMDESKAMLTDSGGIQEETTVLGIPCITLRETTERPVTVTHGTNRVVGTDPARVAAAWREVKESGPRLTMPEGWDGRAAERIVEILREHVTVGNGRHRF